MTTADPDRTAEQRARLAQVLELSPGAALETLSRREVARRLLEAKDSPVARLAREHSASAFTFARETAAATSPAWPALSSIPRPGSPAAL